MQQLYYKIRSYYKMRRFYYKIRRLLEIATVQYFKPTLWQRTSPKFRSSYNNCWQGATIFSKNSEKARNISGNMTRQGFFCYLSLANTKTSSFVVGSVFSSVNSCESLFSEWNLLRHFPSWKIFRHCDWAVSWFVTGRC